jgi:hypothetical protein
MGRDALHPAPRQMNTLATQIQELAAVLSNAEEVVAAFQALRDACSDEQWDELCERPEVDALLTVLMDLEEAVDS